MYLLDLISYLNHNVCTYLIILNSLTETFLCTSSSISLSLCMYVCVLFNSLFSSLCVCVCVCIQVYVLEVSWSEGSSITVYRRYSDFFEFQVSASCKHSKEVSC